ncbi:MAG: AAA family ATPase [Gemmatirosa sp.]|nr:AAA family ATPase [Gemmatirosa sp.]
MTHGFVLGRFLPYHRGHARLIRAARARVDALTVLVAVDDDDPIPYGVRSRWVRDAHPDCHVVRVSRGDEVAGAVPLEDADGVADGVSGPAILRDPMGHWDDLPAHVRPSFVRRVALLGTESVGKSVLAARLAETFDTEWVREYGRDYCEHRDAMGLALVDFEAIAWGQATWEDEAAKRANRVLFCDTELHTTGTWSDLVVGTRPSWLTDAARARCYDLVLLLAPDVPFVHDDVRVLAERRAEHHARLVAELDAAGRRYVTLGGGFETRTAAAIAAVRALLAAPDAR